MLSVFILRWMFGFFEFEVRGRFPERFINIASRNGINMWNMKGSKNSFSAAAKTGAADTLRNYAKKTGCELTIQKSHGLPYLIKKYTSRCGIAAGLALSIALYIFLTGFVWNISIEAPTGINSYEIRALLRKEGIYEGARISSFNTEQAEKKLFSTRDDIGWIAINLCGTDINTSISAKQDVNRENNKEIYNILSSADGIVTRMEIANGTAAVKVNDGIRKGQLLVSGIGEYSNGKTHFDSSRAKIYADTYRTVTISIPKKTTSTQYSMTGQRSSVTFFGIELPTALFTGSEGTIVKSRTEQAVLFEKILPVKRTTELIYTKSSKDIKLNTDKAKEILTDRSKLYEIFMLADKSGGVIKKKSCRLQESDSEYTIITDYTIEQNVAVRQLIETDRESD